jgi:hypothetical protein
VEEQADPLVVAVELHAWHSRDIQQLVQRYQDALAAKESIPAPDKRLYSNAYVYWGYYHYCRGEAREAMRRFVDAARLDPANDLAVYCGGLLELKSRHFGAAVSYLRQAKAMDGPLASACEVRLGAISDSLLKEAEGLVQRGAFIAAAECYRFLATNYGGAVQEQAQKQLKATEDEVAAEKLLVEARQALSMGREIDARKLLKELMTTYSWTRAGEMAKRIYRGSEDLEVKVKTDSPAGEYAAREKWIDLETANCIVYYRSNEQAKLVAKRVEETLARVTAQLEYSDLDWHQRKCKVFVFDDARAWSEFLRKSGAATEWAGGFAYGPLREVYLHAGDPDQMLDGVLPHELTHIIHREYVREDTFLPLWLLEGLACANEFSGKDRRRALVRDALAADRLIPLDNLTAYRDYPRGAEGQLFYSESLMLVEFILDRFGHEGLAALHKRLRKETEFDKLVKHAFKTDAEDFERQWLEYIRTGK